MEMQVLMCRCRVRAVADRQHSGACLFSEQVFFPCCQVLEMTVPMICAVLHSVSVLQVIAAPTECFVLAIFYITLYLSQTISPVWQDLVVFPAFKHVWSHLQLVVECILMYILSYQWPRSTPKVLDGARSVYSKSYCIGGVCLSVSISGCTWEGFCDFLTMFWSREIKLASFFMQGPRVLMNLACVILFTPPCLLGSSAVRKGCCIGLLWLILRQSFGVVYLLV